MNRIINGFLIFIFLLFQFSCSAPHNNPLDPVNPDYQFASIVGTVQSYSIPYIGIQGVSVYWQPGDILVQTDTSGNFQINRIKAVNGELTFSKEGYRTDTILVVWNGSKKISTNINLNKVPKLDSVSIYTEVINQYYPSPTSNLFIDAKIGDSDNDISSVFVRNTELQLNKELNFNVSSKTYQTELTMAELNIKDIEETIGLNFDIVVKDVFNNEFVVGSGKVIRVIKNGAVILSPANDTTLVSSPELQWQRFTPGYMFSYKIELYTSDIASSNLVESKAGIASDSISYQVQTPLTSGTYYWVVWVIDKFNNRVRSLPATFRIQ